MWRYLAGAVAALLLVAAGIVLFNSRARPGTALAALPALQAQATPSASEPLPDTVPEATERTREQKRFDRYDKDRNNSVTREEYLMQRHKAFAKLDTNHDGVLSFDEWAIKAETKFATADVDKSGALTRAEFATTKVQRKAHIRKPCPADTPAPVQSEDS